MVPRYALRVLPSFVSLLLVPGLVYDLTAQQTTLETDQTKVEFLEHHFVCFYEIYRTAAGSERIKYLYQITNLSEFDDKEIRWNSANIKVPWLNRREQSKPYTNDIRLDSNLHPERFDAYRQTGLNGIEIDRIMPGGNTMTYGRQNAPCYLPEVELSWVLFKEGYPPYRWANEFFRKPYTVLQRISNGRFEIKFSSVVEYVNDEFVYTYSAETDSLGPVYFQWLSAASNESDRLDGLIGEVSKDKPYKARFESSKGPELVLDVVVMNIKGQDLLPMKLMERLRSQRRRVQARFLGGSTLQEGRVGIEDIPAEMREVNSFFLSPSIVTAGSDPSVSLGTE